MGSAGRDMEFLPRSTPQGTYLSASKRGYSRLSQQERQMCEGREFLEENTSQPSVLARQQFEIAKQTKRRATGENDHRYTAGKSAKAVIEMRATSSEPTREGDQEASRLPL